MALTLSEQQLARSEDRILTDKRVDRIAGLRAPTVQGELMHYSDKYGRTLTDNQVQAIDKNQEDFFKGINEAKGNISKAASDVQTAYQGQRDKLASLLSISQQDFNTYWDSAPKDSIPEESFMYMPDPVNEHNQEGGGSYGQVVDYPATEENYKNTIVRKNFNQEFESKAGEEYHTWKQGIIDTKTVPYNIYNNGQLVGSYRVTPEDFQKIQESAAQNQQQGGPWIPVGDGLEVRGYGAEIMGPLDQYTLQLQSSLIDSYITGVREQLPQLQAGLEQEYGQAQATLTLKQQEVQGYEQQNTEALTTMRMKYQEKLANIKDTIGSMING